MSLSPGIKGSELFSAYHNSLQAIKPDLPPTVLTYLKRYLPAFFVVKAKRGLNLNGRGVKYSR